MDLTKKVSSLRRTRWNSKVICGRKQGQQCDTLGFDVIRRAAKTGSYLLEEHTVGFVRKEMWIPSVFQQISLNLWMESRSKTMLKRIREKLKTLLDE